MKDSNQRTFRHLFFKTLFKIFFRPFFCLCFIFILSSCKSPQDSGEPVEQNPPDSEVEDKMAASYDMNFHKLTNLVCDPFSEDSGQDQVDLGVKASLFWLRSDDPLYGRVSDYLDFGQASEEILFFSKIDVPTRKFDLGFPKETGELLKDDLGQDLVEYFALRFDGEIQLGPDDENGRYELALLSDDGTVLRIDQNSNGMTEVIDNDGNHPTRMGCGSNAKIDLTAGQRLPFQLDYYQGPRNHISAVLMWRKIDNETPADPLCGSQGNRKFFDYDNDSEPQAAYHELLQRDWKPLQASNFAIKEQDSHNPCNNGEKPWITDFSVEEDFDGGLRVTWKTDVYATSQVRIVNLETNQETLTDSDNFLRKDHFVRVFPEKNTPLLIQAVSVSDTMGKALSDPITLVWE